MSRNKPEAGSAQRRSLFGEIRMKPKTRDNLIYLAVGLAVVAFVVEQDFYAESHHGLVIGRLPTVAARSVISMLVVGWFVGREAKRASATHVEAIVCVVVAVCLQLVICLGSRQLIDQLSGMSYVGLAALETFLMVNLATWAFSRFRKGARTGDRSRGC
jgi:hypothetical protein